MTDYCPNCHCETCRPICHGFGKCPHSRCEYPNTCQNAKKCIDAGRWQTPQQRIHEGHGSPLAVAPESGSPSPVARGSNPEGDASGGVLPEIECEVHGKLGSMDGNCPECVVYFRNRGWRWSSEKSSGELYCSRCWRTKESMVECTDERCMRGQR